MAITLSPQTLALLADLLVVMAAVPVGSSEPPQAASAEATASAIIETQSFTPNPLLCPSGLASRGPAP